MHGEAERPDAMPHVLITGVTESGKTTLAKRLCWSYSRRGIRTVVLDPLSDPGWNSNYCSTNPVEFLDIVKRSRSCAVFIDESGEMIGHYNDEMFWLATRGRHYGHNCHFITQRPAQISPNVRNQCLKLFLFTVSKDDAKLLSNEWNKPELLEANMLRQFECFSVERFSPVKKILVSP